MESIKRSFVLIILFSFSGTVISQDAVKVLDGVYGLDQTLCNGKKYNCFFPLGTRGDQYLISPYYFAGTLTLKGKCYQDVTLNYDIFNQQLLLKYKDESDAMNIIEVSKAWIKSFRLGTMNFELLNLKQEPHFFQVLGEGPVRIFYYWSKNLKLDGTSVSYYYTFTHAGRDSYVYMDGQLRPFSTKRSLIRLFNPGQRAEIKEYMRKNKVRVNKASDEVMSEMINFIGKIR